MPKSLSFRLFALVILWTGFALLVTGFLISTIFKQYVEDTFVENLRAQAYTVIGTIVVDDQGVVTGSPTLEEIGFVTPSSGWYWSVASDDKPEVPLLHSPSIDLSDLKKTEVSNIEFADFVRSSRIDLGSGVISRQLEMQVVLGDDEKLYRIKVGGNPEESDGTVRSFISFIAVLFSIFALGTLASTRFVIKFMLKPLNLATEALHDVREGKEDRLVGEFPPEVQPLASEINGLIDANKAVVDRARTQVGNLAHALKTPLAVILNDSRGSKTESAALISEQAELMKSQVQAYLDRARIAALRGSTSTRTEIVPVLEKLLRVMRKLSPNLKFNLHVELQNALVKCEQQDLEEIMGNLLENAARFASQEIDVSVGSPADISHSDTHCRICISDDGVGLSEEEKRQALKRGIRLDESQPGSGLGLSIVNDIVAEYGGKFELNDSEGGGLTAAIILPITSPNRNLN